MDLLDTPYPSPPGAEAIKRLCADALIRNKDVFPSLPSSDFSVLPQDTQEGTAELP